MMTSIWEILYIFSRKDVGRKNVYILPTFISVKLFNFNFKDVSRMSQSVIGTILGGVGAPPNVSTPFPSWLNWTEPKWSEAIQKVASIWLKIAEQVAYG